MGLVDERREVGVAYLEFGKAFDIFSYNTLIDKLMETCINALGLCLVGL